jgi:hypothetical protein
MFHFLIPNFLFSSFSPTQAYREPGKQGRHAKRGLKPLLFLLQPKQANSFPAAGQGGFCLSGPLTAFPIKPSLLFILKPGP